MHPAAHQKRAYIALGDKVEKRLQFYTSIGQKHDEAQNPNTVEDTFGAPEHLVGLLFMMVQKMTINMIKMHKTTTCKSSKQTSMR